MRRAYHDIILPDGTRQEGPVVVETDAQGHVLGWHKLQEEEANTEWIGDTCDTRQNFIEVQTSSRF